MFFYRVACFMLLPVALAAAADKREASEPKLVSGMSIVGNNETPKSLYIVPWKAPDVGKEMNFTSSMLNEELNPVDKNDFIREIEFYNHSNPNQQ